MEQWLPRLILSQKISGSIPDETTKVLMYECSTYILRTFFYRYNLNSLYSIEDKQPNSLMEKRHSHEWKTPGSIPEWDTHGKCSILGATLQAHVCVH